MDATRRLRRRELTLGAAALGAGALVGCATRRSPAPPQTAAAMRFRPAADRGARELGWLRARFSFSFADYRDPAFDGFRALRVMNEDRIASGGGFPLHPHRDMEIVTYLLGGTLEHRDTLGHGGTIRRGLAQRMSAGSGIRHSEFNRGAEETHLLQIWLRPTARGLAPSYEEQPLPEGPGAHLIAAPPGAGGAVSIESDARIHALHLRAGEAHRHPLDARRFGWVQMVAGRARVQGQTLRPGDAMWSESPGGDIRVDAERGSELLLFDLG